MADWEQSVVVVSYNEPKLCSNASWSANGTVVYRTSTGRVELHAIFITRKDQIYIPLAWNNSVLVIDRNNNSCTRNLSDIFVSKLSIFVTDNDDLYVGDTAKNLTYRFRSNGTFSTFNTPHPESCYGLSVDANGTLYCSVLEKDTIYKISVDTTDPNSWQIVVGEGQLQKPQGIVVDDSMMLYVADTDNQRIQVFQLPNSSTPVSIFNGSKSGLQLMKPTSIALDQDKRMYIVDNEYHRVFVIDPITETTRCIIACDGPNGNGTELNRLHLPIGIAFDSAGNIYVTDSNNHRVLKFDYQLESCGEEENWFELNLLNTSPWNSRVPIIRPNWILGPADQQETSTASTVTERNYNPRSSWRPCERTHSNYLLLLVDRNTILASSDPTMETSASTWTEVTGETSSTQEPISTGKTRG